MKVSQLTARIAGEGAAAWNIHYRAMARQQAGDDITVLSVGDPDFTTPARIMDAARDSLYAGNTHYADVQGKQALREAIVDHYRKYDVDASADQLIVLAGAQCGLYATAQCLLDPEDEVIVPEPGYVTYEAVIQSTGASLVQVPLRADNGFQLDVADITAAITPKTRAILLNSPHNPTGTSIGPEQWQTIAELCRAHDLWLISDEVYADLVFDGSHTCAASLAGIEDRTVVISSLSKSHAMTGWRLGWVMAPPALIGHLSNLALCMLYGCPDFIQDAGIAALKGDHGELEVMRDAYRQRRDAVCQALAHSDAVTAICPDAGMFVMVDIRRTGLSSAEFADRLLDEHGISALSGEAFGPSAAGFIRLSLTQSPERLTQASLRLRQCAEACLSTSSECL
ncbi:pyridoxal phosphate-dependent aminotransferase [Halomonas huangheensis]|uniref:Aminotransferase n=1 Tax=Halomonas huangheensis TaxID=1178482 RepID=W1NAP4_9GAMM|nr:pyridoxal phosphate-dependent aminotransferase [Halomonas huangheensis]ALM52444.1 aspartate aminotransferase [Halomonas huangheensis]ERL52632.1 hypothetical protein BJB45_18815 [Halomonas huangheensis]